MQGGCWQLANIARFCHVVASTAHFGRQTFLPLPSSPISYFFSCASVCRVRLMPTTMNFEMNYHFRHSIVDVVYVTLICQIYVHLKTTRWRTFKLDANDSTINLISTKNGIKSSWSINCKCKLLRRMHTMHIAHIFSLPKNVMETNDKHIWADASNNITDEQHPHQHLLNLQFTQRNRI